MIHHVLVYGTLRRGGSNHALLTSARFLSTLRTPGFVLYHLGAYPAACPAAEHQLITCELYQVDRATLAHLDQLEGYPSFYDRRQVAVTLPEYSAPIDAWIYHMNEEQLQGQRPLSGGDWLAWLRAKDRSLSEQARSSRQAGSNGSSRGKG